MFFSKEIFRATFRSKFCKILTDYFTNILMRIRQEMYFEINFILIFSINVFIHVYNSNRKCERTASLVLCKLSRNRLV